MGAVIPDLAALYEQDRADHRQHARAGTPEYRALRARDATRRTAVRALLSREPELGALDCHHAASIMNHGDDVDDLRIAHELALRSATLGHRPARWLAAATFDRWQMYQGLPQRYGTNYVSDGARDRLWDVRPETTDEERAEWDVPPLADQLRKADEANRNRVPPSPRELEEYRAGAPGWLREALERWRRKDGTV